MGAEVASLLLLAAVLAAAVIRPHGLPEALIAVPAAGLLVATGVVSVEHVQDEFDRLLPVLAFLAAVLALAHLCAAEGLFEAAGKWLSRSSGASGVRLLVHVFALSAAITSVLSLDATVVLLTPVVLGAAMRMRVPPAAHVYATGHLSNSASLLLPMANLTNLLAISASGLTLAHFGALMTVPFLVVLAVEFAVLRWYFRADLAVPAQLDDEADDVPVPVFAVGVLVLTLIGFVASSFLDVEPYWVAIAAAGVLGVHALARKATTVRSIAVSTDPLFLLFVFGLAVVVRGVVDHGLGDHISEVTPDSEGLLALLAFAAVAAVLANVVNNLPALLILIGPAALAGPIAVLAVLIGVNVGPNLTYTGSLATLLWRRVLDERGLSPSWRRFTVLGLLTVPVAIVVATVGLWAVALVIPAG